jgi:hypothetical protein
MVFSVSDQHIVWVFIRLWRNSTRDNRARNLLVIGVLRIWFGKLQSHKNFPCLQGRWLPARSMCVLDSIGIPETDLVCTICGCEEEDDHHALIRCNLARALREEMRSVSQLPPEEEFQKTGKEWILHILRNASTVTRSMIIFLLWRVWHHQNNVVRGDRSLLRRLSSVTTISPSWRSLSQTFRVTTRLKAHLHGQILWKV